ncbi:hypothetical protein, partial [Klebsiella pneumoniae]|uniref:hypothetical protein n=1 Tax=Klebsiella pneumoniae TaxID=573 RepID=UPI003853B93A
SRKPRASRKERNKQELSILLIMTEGSWYRPMDLGGFDKSYHNRALARLCSKGLVHFRQRVTKDISLNHSHKGSKEYSLTEKGIEEQERIIARRQEMNRSIPEKV